MVAPDALLDGKGVVVISSEEGETEANNYKKLSELGILDGSILKVDDFLQNYDLTVAVNHYEAEEKDDPPYKIEANRSELNAKEAEMNGKENGPGKENNEEESDDDDLMLVDSDTEEDPQEGSSKKRKPVDEATCSKKRKPNPPEEQDDLCVIED